MPNNDNNKIHPCHISSVVKAIRDAEEGKLHDLGSFAEYIDEDVDDIREAQSALKEVNKQGSIPFDEMKKRLS